MRKSWNRVLEVPGAAIDALVHTYKIPGSLMIFSVVPSEVYVRTSDFVLLSDPVSAAVRARLSRSRSALADPCAAS